MSEPTGCAGGCLRTDTYCNRCDLLVGLPGLRVIDVLDRIIGTAAGLVDTRVVVV